MTTTALEPQVFNGNASATEALLRQAQNLFGAPPALKRRPRAYVPPVAAQVFPELHIGASGPIAEHVLPALRGGFCPAFPMVRVFTFAGSDAEIAGLLWTRRIELAIFADPCWAEGLKLQPFLVPGSNPSQVLYFAYLDTGRAARAFIRSAITGPR